MNNRRLIVVLMIVLFSFTVLPRIAYGGACWSDSDCVDTCKNSYELYYNGDCISFWCWHSTYDCSKERCRDSTRLWYNGYCSGGKCYAYSKTCSWKCEGDVCYDCKSTGSSCSDPGTSTLECCSGTCGYIGKCVSCTDECYPPDYPKCSGDTKYECIKKSDNCYDKVGTSCAYGCSNGECNPNPCEGVSCDSYCSGDTKYYNGYCLGGSCYYSSYNCNDDNYYGDWVYYCSGNDRRKHRKYYDYDCSGGSCVYDDWEWRDDRLVETCEFGCDGTACFACDLAYCLEHSAACCTREDVCKEDYGCNTNCEYGSYPDPDCCDDECTDGEFRCVGGGNEKCYDSDSDGCTEWTGWQSCAYCVNGNCVQCISDSHCLSDGWYCDSGNYREYRDYSCSNNNCVHSDLNREDCDDKDGYYCKNSNEREYRDYFCLSGSCTYSSSNLQSCEFGCVDNACFACDLAYCLEHSAACCTREDVCKEDYGCNTNCEYGSYPDPDCCDDECTNNGEKRCENDIEETCGDHDSDGCLEWGGSVDCEFGCEGNLCFACDLDYCVEHSAACCTREAVCREDSKCNTNCEGGNYPDPDCCSDECSTNGQTRCLDSEIKQTCGDYDTDVCLDWGNDEGCGEYCINGQCHHCDIPDGSSWECECDGDAECRQYGDYYCNQVSGPDSCEELQWQDACSNYNDYFCEDGDVYQCKNAGKRYEKVLVDNCGTNKFCDSQSVEGIGKCSVYPNHLDLWVDYAGVGVEVNKQPGDKLKVNIYSERDFVATLSYDSSVFSGDCPNGQISLVRGKNSCNLVVDDYAEDGKYKITLDENVAIVNVVYYPSLIVVSDSEKLNERFPNQPRGVMALLAQAYDNAKEDGVVYDLSWYYGELGESNPFNSFLSYDEKISKPKNFDNSYSLAVGGFIRGRCYACTDIMVVGDDYVVPHYRRRIDTIGTKWIFWEERGIKDIYTDMPYSQKEVLQFSNYYEIFMIEGEYSGKEVLVILPDGISTEQRAQVNRLKQAFIDREFNPDFSEMNGKDAYCVDERWFPKVNGTTLIIIGTEENNNAFECMPFVAGDVNRNAVFIQPNVWDNKEYALVINTNDAGVIEFFAQMVEDEKVVELKGKEAYLFRIGVQYASYAALGVGVGALILFSGGTAAPAFIYGAMVLDGIADWGDVVDSCEVNYEGVGWCGVSIGFAVIPLASSAPAKRVLRNMDDVVFNSNLKHFFENVDDLISRYFRKLRKVFGNEAFEGAAETAYDNKHLAKGTDQLVMESGKDADSVLIAYKNQFINSKRGQKHALRNLIKIGKYNDEFFEANKLVRYTDTKKRIFRVDNRHPSNIIKEGVGFKSLGDSLDYEKYVRENVPSRFIGGSRTPIGGFEAAKSTGSVLPGGGSWVYVIDPRARNFVDDLATLPDPGPKRLIEEGIVAIDGIDPDDIIGAVYMKEGTGEIIDTFVNSNYKSKLNLRNIDYGVG